MKCPFCGDEDTQVKDSRPAEEGSAIRRRRRCNSCGARFSTFERIQLRDISVVKRDRSSQIFNRDKIYKSIAIALQKRPVTQEKIEQIVSSIVRRIETLGEAEVPSSAIGEMVMQSLQITDTVAYVRFASVYRNFTEASDFSDFVKDEGFN